MTAGGFLANMEKRGLTTIHPDLLKFPPKNGKVFSDAAMKRVAESMNFKEKAGFNPTAPDAASNLSTNSHFTDGAETNRSVTSADIQCKLPELRIELQRLREHLAELSPDDQVLKESDQQDEFMDDNSLNSSASAALAALFKDTISSIKQLKARISEIEHGSPPPPASGSAVSTPSKEKDGDCEMAQGE